MFVELMFLLLAPELVKQQSEYRDDGMVVIYEAPPPAPAVLTTQEDKPPENAVPLNYDGPLRKPTIAPQEWAEQCKPWDEWDKPAPPFKIYGNTYYVGTCGITVLLVRTGNGFVLLDTGTQQGAIEVLRNIERMGLYDRNIGLILYSHEHFDHVGGLAFVQRISQAPIVAPQSAAKVLLTGQDDPNDPQAGLHEPMKPASSVIEIAPGSPITYGGTRFVSIATPGHTPGALSWQWESCEGPKENKVCKTIVYADSLSPVSRDGYKFSDHPEYVAEYRAGIERLAKLDCDILLTPHPSHSRMVRRAATGTFEGGVTCAEYAAGKMRDLDARLEREAGGDQ